MKEQIDRLKRALEFVDSCKADPTNAAATGAARDAREFLEMRQLYNELTDEERWETARHIAYARRAAALPAPSRANGVIDVARTVQLAEHVADAFKNYTGGTGLDAKQLADEIPRILDSHADWRNRALAAETRCSQYQEALAEEAGAVLARSVHTVPRKTPAETQTTISAWAEATFGPSGSNARAVARANREMSELLERVTADDRHPEAAEEIADIVIVLYRVATRLGVDLHQLIDRKMITNRARTWRLDGTGHGYHVKDSNDSEPEETQ